ncbi:hypothetical protein QOT17_017072 [Balamuthia mandrillaris]
MSAAPSWQKLDKKQILGVYKALLGEVNKHITPVSNNTLWRNKVMSEFRRNREVTSDKERLKLYRVAVTSVNLLRSMQEQQRLWQYYGIGGPQTSSREELERVAKRVGMRLPGTNNP